MAIIGYLFVIVLFSFSLYLCSANPSRGECKPLAKVSHRQMREYLVLLPREPKCKYLKKMTTEEINVIASLIEANQVNTKAVLTTEEAAKYLGVTKSAIYKLTMGRKIPHYRSQGGKLLYFQREEIERWATSCRIATNEELEAKAKSLSNKKGGKR